MNGVSTEAIADSFWLGDNPEDDYGLSRHELLVALWFEATQGCPRFRKRWREWGEAASQVLWDPPADIERVPLPPVRDHNPDADTV